MIHLIKPKNLPSSVYYSQLLRLKETINMNSSFDVRLWVHEKDAELDGYDYIFEKKLDHEKISNGDIIYCRSPFDYLKQRIYLFNKKIKYLYDFRAIVAFESWYRNRSIIRFLILIFLELFCYLTADQLNAVSKNLVKKIYTLFIIRREVNVIPCLTSKKENISFPKKDDEIRFVYIGSTSEWQCIREIFIIYNRIYKEFNSSLTFYTKDKKYIYNLAKNFNFEVNCKFVRHEDIDKELRQYHFGFLIREDNVINQVSSPIKFLEYISNGVIPIMTKNIGDYSTDVIQYNLGIILDYNKIMSSQGVEYEVENFISDRNIYERMSKYIEKKTWDHFKDDIILIVSQ